MDRTAEQWHVVEGTDVVGSDGAKVGRVVEVQPSFIVVEKGFFFPTDHFIPTSAIANYDGDKVYLSVSKDEALSQGWDERPVDTEAYATGVGMGTTDVTMRDAGTAPEFATGVEPQTVEGGRGQMAEGDTLRVPVHEEELTATKHSVELGQVQVRKDVVAEQRTMDVPVTEERVRVERRVVEGDVPASDTAFQEGTISVPIRGEEVDLQKRTRIAEEVEIGKEQVERQQRVAGTVRREEVHVDENVSNVNAASREASQGASGQR